MFSLSSEQSLDEWAQGRAAIDYLLTATVDLILMDCQMPELDGYEASRLIRQGAAGTNSIRKQFRCRAHFSSDQVTTKCGASGIADVDLVTFDDFLCVYHHFQRAFVVGRHRTGSAACGV